MGPTFTQPGSFTSRACPSLGHLPPPNPRSPPRILTPTRNLPAAEPNQAYPQTHLAFSQIPPSLLPLTSPPHSKLPLNSDLNWTPSLNLRLSPESSTPPSRKVPTSAQTQMQTRYHHLERSSTSITLARGSKSSPFFPSPHPRLHPGAPKKPGTQRFLQPLGLTNPELKRSLAIDLASGCTAGSGCPDILPSPTNASQAHGPLLQKHSVWTQSREVNNSSLPHFLDLLEVTVMGWVGRGVPITSKTPVHTQPEGLDSTGSAPVGFPPQPARPSELARCQPSLPFLRPSLEADRRDLQVKGSRFQ